MLKKTPFLGGFDGRESDLTFFERKSPQIRKKWAELPKLT
jgi:hypothetical protein